jgi:hypothetical protein
LRILDCGLRIGGRIGDAIEFEGEEFGLGFGKTAETPEGVDELGEENALEDGAGLELLL